MTEVIRTIELENNSALTGRDVSVSEAVSSVDINQVDGSYLASFPLDENGGYEGKVVWYPQSQELGVYSVVEFQTLNIVGSLYSPLDARFDYVRRKIWIADSGNHRIVKIDMEDQDVDLAISNTIYYPYSIAVNYNTGGIFVKGYDNVHRSVGRLTYFDLNGSEIATFLLGEGALNSSSSSSSSSQDEGVTSSSSSSGDLIPELPSPRSIAYDSVRSRCWWIDGRRIYQLDERNEQVNTYDMFSDGYYGSISIDIELSTGNAFVVATDLHDETFVVQMNRDNSSLLASAYLEE